MGVGKKQRWRESGVVFWVDWYVSGITGGGYWSHACADSLHAGCRGASDEGGSRRAAILWIRVWRVSGCKGVRKRRIGVKG